MSEERCGTCRYSHDDGGHLICRRFPPITRYDMVQPRVYSDDWCGEFKADIDRAFVSAQAGGERP
jgi:hypothetical protein